MSMRLVCVAAIALVSAAWLAGCAGPEPDSRTSSSVSAPVSSGSVSSGPVSPGETTSPDTSGVFSSTPSGPATGAAAPADCPGAQLTVAQLAGAWTEEGSPAVTTLGADGTLTVTGDGSSGAGTWSFVLASSTPAADRMPAAAAESCVLWLQDGGVGPGRVLLPLSLTGDELTLSYVGRGNTLVWTRAKV
jgi:hypothetical protein